MCSRSSSLLVRYTEKLEMDQYKIKAIKGALKWKSNLPAYFFWIPDLFSILKPDWSTKRDHEGVTGLLVSLDRADEGVWRVHNDLAITSRTKRRLRIVAVTGMVSVQELGERSSYADS